MKRLKLYRPYAKDAAHTCVFILALALIVKGGLLSSPADLGEIAAATTLLGLVGIARA
jgi:hypothetical protein